MKVERIVLGRAIRFIKLYYPPGGVYMPAVTQALCDKYGFLDYPKEFKDYDETRGIHFRHGKFLRRTPTMTREVVIDTFSVFGNGVIADTTSYTDDAHAFLDDVIDLAVNKLSGWLPMKQNIENYSLSNIEFSSENDFDEYFAFTKKISALIASSLRKASGKEIVYRLNQISMHMDRTLTTSPLGPFTLERREGTPFDMNVFFSAAPLATADHIEILKALDESA